MSDQTGEYTGEMIFDGQSVTRVLGTSYSARSPATPASGSRLTPTRLAALSRTWALGELQEGDQPSGLNGLTQGEVHRALRAARDLIVEEGFSALGMDRLLVRARLSPEASRALRAHFSSGEEVAVVLMRRVHAPLFADLSEAAVSGGSALEGLREVVVRYLSRARQDVPLYQRYTRLFNNVVDPELVAPRVLLVLQEIERQAVQITAALLAEGQMRGEVRCGDPELLARGLEMCLNGLVYGVSNVSRLQVVGLDADALLRSSAEVLLAGLAAPGAGSGQGTI